MDERILLTESRARAGLAPRFLVFGVAIILAVTGLGLRLFQLQLAEGSTYAAYEDVALTTEKPIPVSRGLIYDRRGKLLVENVPTFVLRVMPAELVFEQRQEVASRIADLTDMKTRRIVELIDRHTGSQYELVRIADIDTDTARMIAEDPELFPGVHVDLEARRHYTYGKLMSHVLGWTGRISGPEYEVLRDDGYYPEDLIGKAGIEATWEDVLRGTYGLEEVDLDAQGHEVKAPEILRRPEAGHSLELTIDTKVQKNAQKALKWAMDRIGVKRGAFLAMNPQNGEILAMVSLPSYDNNKFARGISMRDYNKLLRDPSKPMLNVAVNEQYPPGSTYKLVTATGALADGRISTTSRINTKPFIEVGDDWKYHEWNGEGWGPLNIYDGFGHSSDTYFYQVAGRLGIDRLAYWAHQYGYGEPTGIDLPGEASGIVPDSEWKQRTKGEIYFTGELYQAGIGQGYNMSTPIQVLNSYAALANGGTIYKPQLVRKVKDQDGKLVERVQPEVIRRMDVDRSVLRVMRQASRRVLTIRHTDNLVDLPIVVAGKSGTSEFGERDKQGRLPFSNWFAAFVPKEARKKASDPLGMQAVKREDSNLVVLAYLDDTRTKGNAATEVVKYFLQLHYGIKQDLRNHHFLVRDNFYNRNS
ncbi:MAG: penicillin-binding protein 2 [Candidatus Limnocylindrales bacterium]